MVGATDPDAVIGKSIYPLITPEHRERFRRFNENVCHGYKGSLEFDIVGLHGTRRHMEIHGAPLRDRDDTILHLGVARDVTESKRAEEALRRSEKLAAVGRLAATVAHEINNPLESVTNLLYLAKKDPSLGIDTLQHLLLADQELERVAQVARQTLGFYRDTTNPSRLNVAKAVDELLGVYGYRLRNREITVTKAMDSSVTVFASSGEFRQVFSNLILNAIDAMTANRGKIWIKVRGAHDWRDGRRGVRVTIADNGCGIGPEHMPRIFDSFYTTKQDIGTGLGLWLVRNILQKHHGRIHVRSRSNRGKSGTAFTVFWPDSNEASISLPGAKAS
jgi:signal transduction histidine kinase